MTVTALHAKKKKKALFSAILFSIILAAGTVGALEGIFYLSSSGAYTHPRGTADPPPRPMVTVLEDEVVIIHEYVGPR